MKKTIVGIVDYRLGNQSSVLNSLYHAGFSVRISANYSDLDECNILLLPGVGSFPAGMQQLRSLGLDHYLLNAAQAGRPIIGICLGMQMLSLESYEQVHTEGLGIIPGRVVRLPCSSWHIGWNSLNLTSLDPVLNPFKDEYFYFNHSYMLVDSPTCVTATVSCPMPVTAAVRLGNVVGLQFHPEKSQLAGKRLLKTLIKDLVDG